MIFSLSVAVSSDTSKSEVTENSASYPYKLYDFCKSGFSYGATAGSILSIPMMIFEVRNVVRFNGHIPESELIPYVLTTMLTSTLVFGAFGSAVAGCIFIPKELIEYSMGY